MGGPKLSFAFFRLENWKRFKLAQLSHLVANTAFQKACICAMISAKAHVYRFCSGCRPDGEPARKHHEPAKQYRDPAEDFRFAQASEFAAGYAFNWQFTHLARQMKFGMQTSLGAKSSSVKAGARRLSISRITVLSGMAVMLVVVAGLQYKWATQLSAATEIRLGNNLQSLMTSWHRDLYDELSAVCIAIQVGPDSGAHDAWNDYLQRYAEWSRAGAMSEFAGTVSANPDLVQEIYDWQTSSPGKPELLRLDPNAKILESVSVPRELEVLLARLKANSSNVQMAMRAWEFRNSSESEPQATSSGAQPSALRSNALAGWQLDDRIPALVHPVVHHANPFNSQTPVDRVAVDWLVVVLNFDVIRNRTLPELANRHFGGPDGLDYKLAVVATGERHRVIYSSDSTLKIDDVGSFDSVMNIFGSSANNVQGEFWQAVQHGRNLPDRDRRNLSAMGWFTVVQYNRADEPWVLMLQHRTEPVSKIVSSVWHRNILTGGIVLMLLAANVGLVVFASHRAHKLATMQMEFVASVSHELLTPLSAIYCSGQNAKDGLLQTKTDWMAHGSIITSQARQLIDLVRQNLLFAATQSGTYRYTLCPLQVSEILECVRKNVAALIEESGSSVEYEVPVELPKVMGDLSGVTQCLQNLIGNAIKYSGRSSWIGISAALHDAKNDSKEVRISVQDHGPGINSTELRHIFEPFYRSPKVVNRQIHGTGLGLTVAARIAEAMGGRLSVTSEVGIGSTFTLHLPVGKAVAENASVSPESDLGVLK
jgi:signal transduction histidine kinase